jgi:hypothetical protein
MRALAELDYPLRASGHRIENPQRPICILLVIRKLERDRFDSLYPSHAQTAAVSVSARFAIAAVERRTASSDQACSTSVSV